jgi:hypothetical protein
MAALRSAMAALRRAALAPLLILVALGSAAVVLMATARTSSANYAARTTNEGNLFTSAPVSVDVESPTERQAQLFLEGTGLYPGKQLENCLRIVDRSSVDAVDYRLFSPAIEGELGAYFEISITVATVSDETCQPDPEGEVVFTGTLGEFAGRHESFETGLVLEPPDPGTELALFVEGALMASDEAQGLRVSYDVVLEVRPL